MNTITIFAFVAVAITGLALIHETRLRQAARNLLCRFIRSRRSSSRLACRCS